MTNISNPFASTIHNLARCQTRAPDAQSGGLAFGLFTTANTSCSIKNPGTTALKERPSFLHDKWATKLLQTSTQKPAEPKSPSASEASRVITESFSFIAGKNGSASNIEGKRGHSSMKALVTKNVEKNLEPLRRAHSLENNIQTRAGTAGGFEVLNKIVTLYPGLVKSATEFSSTLSRETVLSVVRTAIDNREFNNLKTIAQLRPDVAQPCNAYIETKALLGQPNVFKSGQLSKKVETNLNHRDVTVQQATHAALSQHVADARVKLQSILDPWKTHMLWPASARNTIMSATEKHLLRQPAVRAQFEDVSKSLHVVMQILENYAMSDSNAHSNA